MLIQIQKNILYSYLKVDSFIFLEEAIDSIAPSNLEYYLNDLINIGNNSLNDNFLDLRFSKNNIKDFLNLGDFVLYLDFEDEIYLEKFTSYDNDHTNSLW